MAATISVPSRSEILSLYRSLLRTAKKFPDYNIREYVKRRTIDGFRQNSALSDPSSVSFAFSDGKSQLEIARKQSVVYSLYAPKVKSVMEIKTREHIHMQAVKGVLSLLNNGVQTILSKVPMHPLPLISKFPEVLFALIMTNMLGLIVF